MCRDMPITQPLVLLVPSTVDGSKKAGEWKTGPKKLHAAAQRRAWSKREQTGAPKAEQGSMLVKEGKNGFPFRSQNPGPLPSAAP